jgi:hypothetical protein
MVAAIGIRVSGGDQINQSFFAPRLLAPNVTQFPLIRSSQLASAGFWPFGATPFILDANFP